jgi:hypothetical protein
MIPASSLADFEALFSPDEVVCGIALTGMGLLNLIDFDADLLATLGTADGFSPSHRRHTGRWLIIITVSELRELIHR